MNINEYQIQAKRTCPSLNTIQEDIIHMNFGIISEWGEVVDIFKKYIAYNKEIDLVNLGEELADISWYVVNESTIRYGETSLSFLTKFAKDSFYFLEWTEKIMDLSFIELLDLIKDLNLTKMEGLSILALCDALCIYFNIDYYEYLEKNIAKFNSQNALNRNLENERKELEK